MTAKVSFILASFLHVLAFYTMHNLDIECPQQFPFLQVAADPMQGLFLQVSTL